MARKLKKSGTYVMVSVRIDPLVFAEINALAASKGITTSTALRRAIGRYLKSTDTKGATQ